MRIALFGGTFDPPHRGHIAIARAAADAFSLDQVLFAPTGLQPLKLEVPATPYVDRLAMVKAACESDPRFAPSGLDAPRTDGAPNYTVDTLIALRAERPDDKLFNLVGADSFLHLRYWRDSDRLLELADWIVVSRPGYPVDKDNLVNVELTAAGRSRVHILAGVAEDVSASELRARLRIGNSCRDLLSTRVREIIAARSLYQSL